MGEHISNGGIGSEMKVLVVGGGHAGAVAAFAARQANPGAAITVLSDEAHLPYERPALSKEALTLGGWTRSQPKFDERAYETSRIALHRNVRALSLDVPGKTVQASDRRCHVYDRLVLATGSRVRQWDAGKTLDGRLQYLRTVEDALALRARLTPTARVAVIGAGFIGLEVAAAARAVGAHVTVFDRAPTALARVFPPAAARVVEDLHRSRGVDLRLGATITDLVADGAGLAVITTDGVVQVDMAIVGIGVIPNTELAVAAGLAVDDGLLVDTYGRTSASDVFGAGEVTRHPVGIEGSLQRIESWQVAEYQAAAAGASAAGCLTAYDAVPWFWSDQFGMNLQAAGQLSGEGEWVLRGDPAGPHSRFLLDTAGRIRGAIAFDMPKDMAATRRMMQQHVRPPASALQDTAVPMRQLLAAR